MTENPDTARPLYLGALLLLAIAVFSALTWRFEWEFFQQGFNGNSPSRSSEIGKRPEPSAQVEIVSSQPSVVNHAKSPSGLADQDDLGSSRKALPFRNVSQGHATGNSVQADEKAESKLSAPLKQKEIGTFEDAESDPPLGELDSSNQEKNPRIDFDSTSPSIPMTDDEAEPAAESPNQELELRGIAPTESDSAVFELTECDEQVDHEAEIDLFHEFDQQPSPESQSQAPSSDIASNVSKTVSFNDEHILVPDDPVSESLTANELSTELQIVTSEKFDDSQLARDDDPESWLPPVFEPVRDQLRVDPDIDDTTRSPTNIGSKKQSTWPETEIDLPHEDSAVENEPGGTGKSGIAARIIVEPKRDVPDDQPMPSISVEHVVCKVPIDNNKSTALDTSSKKSPWGKSTSLHDQLDLLCDYEPTAAWADRVRMNLDRFTQFESISEPLVLNTIADIHDQLGELKQIIIAVSTVPVESADTAQGDAATYLRRTHYNFERRLEIWAAIHKLALSQQNETPSATFSNVGFRQPFSLDLSQIDPAWAEYLQLNQIIKHQQNADVEERKAELAKAARVTLSRIYSPVMSVNQQEYAYQVVGAELENQLRQTASRKIDLDDFIKDLELHEQHNNGYTRSQLNDHFQNGVWSGQPIPYEFAGAINQHYRNANLRVSITEKLINMLIPEMPALQEPVNDRILGADVFGRSQITNRLNIDLTPDPDRWNIQLQSSGVVRSKTQAHRDGFVFHSVGSAKIFGSKRITISSDGYDESAAQVSANSEQQVIGLNSRYDRIPIVGWAARRVAQKAQQKQSGNAKIQVQRKIKSQIRKRFEIEANKQLADLEYQFNSRFLQPMIELDLEPQPIEMRTTEDRIIARYRLAGFEQMGADSARPRALSGGMMSVQVHHSAINNLLSRTQLDGQSFTFESLVEHLREVTKSDQIQLSDQEHADVNLEFSSHDGICIKFDQNAVVIALHLKRLQLGKGKVWKNVTVETRYIPQVTGLNVVLNQDEKGVDVTGRRLRTRDQIAIGTMFKYVFSSTYNTSLIPSEIQSKFGELGLGITQLVLNDGWIGITFGINRQAAVEPRIIRRR